MKGSGPPQGDGAAPLGASTPTTALDGGRLGKVAALAQRSQNDGEALSALRALNRMLEAGGTDLAEVVSHGVGAIHDKREATSECASPGGAAPATRPAPTRAQPHGVGAPTEVVVTSAQLTHTFKGRFEILAERPPKGGGPMADVKITIARNLQDRAANTVRVAYLVAHWEVASDLRRLSGAPCVFTLRAGTPGEADAIASVAGA